MVDENKVATIGFCFGGSTSLALAYSGAPFEGVVTFHGGLIPAPADVAQKTKAKFLILHGALDPLVNKEAVDKFLKSMNDDKLDYQFVEYSGALHAFSNPERRQGPCGRFRWRWLQRGSGHPILEPDEDIFRRDLWATVYVNRCPSHVVCRNSTQKDFGLWFSSRTLQVRVVPGS